MIKYRDADPSAPHIILEAFKAQGDHRRQLEQSEAEDFRKVRRRGQWMCLAIVMAAIGAGVVCSIYGQPWVGASIVIPTVLGIGVVGGIGLFWRR